MRDPILLDVADSSGIGEVRRAATRLAEHLGFDEDEIGRLSLACNELSTNLIKHASSGLVLIGTEGSRSDTIEMLALDCGPGIPDIAAALRDGHSTTDTAGNGLGAISRKADFFQIYSRPKMGTAVLVRVSRKERESKGEQASIAGVSIPIRGEHLNGDGWSFIEDDGTLSVLVVDGLGHGPLAHDAAAGAVAAFRTAKGSPPDKMRAIHEGIRSTRGAAAALAELDPAAGTMCFAGVGNISAVIIDPTASRRAVSMHGIVGHEVREVRQFSYPWSRESCLIMHSDGLSTRWDPERYPALLTRDPALIAGILWRDHRRPNDDATVVVARTP